MRDGMHVFDFKDPIVMLVMYLDIALLVITLALFTLVVIFRLRLNAQEMRRERFMKRWEPILESSFHNGPQILPYLKRADMMNFLLVWNRMQENVFGEVRERLNHIAHLLKIDVTVCNMLRTGKTSNRLLAINTVGHLRERRAWEDLRSIVRENENTMLVLTAVRALARIDAEEAASVYVPLLGQHLDWPKSQVAVILEDLGPKALSGFLREAILHATEEELPRLICYLQFTTKETALAVATKLLRMYSNPEVIAASIHVIGEFAEKEVDIVRSYVKHDSWVVRLQVVRVLGKLGTYDDIKLLLELVCDKEWWVRYRAASALVNLKFMTTEFAEQIRRKQSDAYARDALTQAIEEKRLLA